jgi:hypothetical protein
MKISKKQLQESKSKFYGILLGTSVVPLGWVKLDIIFGSKDNYRKEKCTFEVVDFDSLFHVLFDRPAYAKFMARSCYILRKLKIPGLKGVITVTSNGEKATECEFGGSAMSQLVANRRELAIMMQSVNAKDMAPIKRPTSEPDLKFKAAEDTKRIALDKSDSSKTAIIGTNLSPK